MYKVSSLNHEEHIMKEIRACALFSLVYIDSLNETILWDCDVFCALTDSFFSMKVSKPFTFTQNLNRKMAV